MKEGIYEVMQWLNDYLTNQKWVAGDILTIADLTLLATISSYIVSAFFPEIPSSKNSIPFFRLLVCQHIAIQK